jgi:hypothetical protein
MDRRSNREPAWDHAHMAHIDHSFHMQEPPPQAQQRFEEEIGWELHRDEGFVAVKEAPGEIDYSDGRVDEVSDEHELPSPRRAPSPEAYAGLRELLARRIKVELAPEGTGTLVRIHGHAEGRLRDAIVLLGAPGHWPEVRWTEGAPTEDA